MMAHSLRDHSIYKKNCSFRGGTGKLMKQVITHVTIIQKFGASELMPNMWGHGHINPSKSISDTWPTENSVNNPSVNKHAIHRVESSIRGAHFHP